MHRILIIGRPDYGGVSWYRHQQFAQCAKKNKLADVQYINEDYEPHIIREVLNKADVILTRLNPNLHELKDMIAEKPFVIDMDDGMEDVDPMADIYRVWGTSEVELSGGEKLWKDGRDGFDIEENKKRLEKFKEILNNVAGVIVTTFTLRNYVSQWNDNVAIVPNAVNLELFPDVSDNEKKKDEVRILWSGGSTHYADLQKIKPVLKSVLENHPNYHFYIVGVPFKGIIRNLPKKQVHPLGWVRADGHGYRLACIDADIGICPINDTPWNRNKSSVKFYELGALKVPTIARGIPPYTDDIAHGINGFTYKTNEHLEELILRLGEDPLLRAKVGSEGYKYVKKNRNIKDITKDWVKFLTGVADAYSRDNNS